MNQHTHRILSKMLLLLEEYQNERIDLGYLVKSLEGSLSALEEKRGSDFYSQWYLHWGGLEEIFAAYVEGLIINTKARESALESAKALEFLIRSELGNKEY